MQKILSPVSYQGAKTRIAADIIDNIDFTDREFFCDLCCGSGAVSLELVSRGYNPEQIMMIDAGPWGLFWKEIGLEEFDFDVLEMYCKQIPKDLNMIQSFILELSKQPAKVDTTQVFLLLQASSFGGKSIWINNNKWINCSFRNFWQPTETSKRRSVVNPMMPMPDTILARTEIVMKKMAGVIGDCEDCFNYNYPPISVIYIDPPYDKTTKYGHNFDYMEFISSHKKQAIYCSESKPLSDKAVLISKGRAKGGISGDRGIDAYEEWLSRFN